MRQTSAFNTGKSPGFANRAERHISTVREGIYGKLCLMDAKARLGRQPPNMRSYSLRPRVLRHCWSQS